MAPFTRNFQDCTLRMLADPVLPQPRAGGFVQKLEANTRQHLHTHLITNSNLPVLTA
jgi:hypothetical protein